MGVFLKVEACCKVTTRGAVSKLFMLEGVMFLRCWCFVGRVWYLQSRRWYEWWKAKEGLDDATLSRDKMYDRRLFGVSLMSMMINCCAGWLGRNPTGFRLSYHDLWWGCKKDALSFWGVEKSFIFFWYQSSLIPKLSWFINHTFTKASIYIMAAASRTISWQSSVHPKSWFANPRRIFWNANTKDSLQPYITSNATTRIFGP